MKYPTIALFVLAFTIIIGNTYGQRKHIELLNGDIKNLVKQKDILYEMQKTTKGYT